MPVHHITFDAHDPYEIAGFWAQVLGGRRQDDDHPGDPSVLVTHAGTPLLFEQVPDGKVVKNRVHLDLLPDRPRDEEVQRLLGLGATLVDDRIRPDGTGWVVLADPEGNELCVERSAAERGAATATPPRRLPAVHTGGERPMLEAMLDWYREGVVAKVSGLGQEDATSTPLRSGTTVAGLVKHLAFVEDHWCTRVLAEQPLPPPWDDAPWDDDPDWEFHSAGLEPLADSIALYERACDRSRAAVASMPLDEVHSSPHGRDVSVRFVLLHLVEETARHLGHLDVLRELADGTTGE